MLARLASGAYCAEPFSDCAARCEGDLGFSEQDLTLQRDGLGAADCGQVFEDCASGAKADRPGLGQALSCVLSGDVLVV